MKQVSVETLAAALFNQEPHTCSDDMRTCAAAIYAAMTDRPDLAAPAMPASPRTAATVTRDWLSGVMLVGMGSVEQGQYEGKAKYEAAANEVIRWLNDNGMRLAIEAEAAQQAAPLDYAILTAIIEDTPTQIIDAAKGDSAEGLAVWITSHWAEYARLAPAEKKP